MEKSSFSLFNPGELYPFVVCVCAASFRFKSGNLKDFVWLENYFKYLTGLIFPLFPAFSLLCNQM